MAEGLVEAGGKVHCLDRAPEPDPAFAESAERMKRNFGGELVYHQVDVSNEDTLEQVVADIAAERQRIDGLIAAAAIQQVTPALDYSAADISKMLLVNYTGVFLSARAVARQMNKYRIHGSICLIASMSGSIANRGFIAPVYNSSKAAVVQLAKNLAMEWGRVNADGSGGIRVNSLSPGHIVTPMVSENFEKGEADRAEWEDNNMLGRLSTPEEYKAAGLFLLSRASSYMTGSNMIIDGGTTAW
ncbi:NAD(P)-binding protein [Bimuria novae-zelandiae CBS 107.79]|uniref:NAD(P)-binding protein n=1 Tax=Bimuria novae-zelandiae CBS 107.79 TaxID=1447943 RepID=A0A6A5VLA1_9PLEO|nr:NAD(P)-binding protein [Bimuria novae-zelandiae CBS 107.79]